MEVLSTGLTDQAGVALVRLDVRSDVLPQFFEHKCAPGEVERRKVGVGDDLCADLCGWAGDELDDTRWYTSLFEDLVNDVVGVCCSR